MKPEFLFRWVNKISEDRAVAAILANGKVKPPDDAEVTAHRGLVALFVGLAFLLLWAGLAPLSQGVPVSGFIKVEGNRKTVQHLRGGIVDAILVREGDAVAEGQPVLRLNETQLKAEMGIIDSKLITALATESRLLAEQRGLGDMTFPEFLSGRASEPLVADAMASQRQLMRTRRTTLLNEEAIGKENIIGLEEQIRGLTAQEKAKSQQHKLYSEELETLRPMYEQGFIPRNRMFELERAVAYLNGQRSEDLANIGRARSQISEIRLKILQSKEIYRKEVETQLSEIKSEVANLRERQIAIKDDLGRVVVRSPSSGVVVDMSVFTVGGVIAPGQKIMDVVPAGQQLLVEVRIPTQLIDNVRSGLEADIHFPALDQFEVPRIPGRLVYVSADRLMEERTNEPYFLGRIEVKPESLHLLGKHKLQTGMPANVVIITGERSFLSYVVRPILARLQFAFTER